MSPLQTGAKGEARALLSPINVDFDNETAKLHLIPPAHFDERFDYVETRLLLFARWQEEMAELGSDNGSPTRLRRSNSPSPPSLPFAPLRRVAPLGRGFSLKLTPRKLVQLLALSVLCYVMFSLGKIFLLSAFASKVCSTQHFWFSNVLIRP